MEQLDSQGYFWLPDASDEMVDGVLSTGEDGDLVLDVRAVLGPGADPDKSFPCIHGMLDDGKNRGAVTLWGVRLFGRTVRVPGRTSERFRCKVVLLGEHLGSEQQARFRDCRVRYSGLDNWALGYTGLKRPAPTGEEGTSFRIEYARPAPLVARLPSGELKLGVGMGGSSQRRRDELFEQVFLVFAPDNPTSLDQLNEQYIHPIQNLMTLATNAPTSLVAWRAIPVLGDQKPSEPARDVGIYFSRYFRDEDAAEKAWPHYLFTLQAVKERFGDVLTRWLTASAIYAEACAIYFGVLYAGRVYLDLQFHSILQALTLYAAKKYATSPDRLPAAEQIRSHLGQNAELVEVFSRLLRTSFLLNAEAALERVVVDHQEIMEWLTGGPTRQFETAVLTTLAYLETRDHMLWSATPMAAAHADGGELYWLTQRLGWLMKACFLDELGFDKATRNELIMRNAHARLVHEAGRRPTKG